VEIQKRRLQIVESILPQFLLNFQPRFLLVELKDAEGGKNELTDTHHSPSSQFIGQQIEANKENPPATELSGTLKYELYIIKKGLGLLISPLPITL
jgi:hypothetical protein